MVSSVGKGCSEADQAYIAGLFDADGAIMALLESHKEKKYGFRVRVVLKLTQKNPELLQWVFSTLHVGYITQNRTTYDFVIKDQQYCEEILKMIQHFSRGKQKQIELALQILHTPIRSREDIITVARLADALSGYNVRSTGRRKNYASKIKEYSSSND